MNSIIRRRFQYQYTGVTYWLIGINILVYVMMYFLGLRSEIALRFAMIPALVVEKYHVWTFVTYMFLHGAGFTHILFNMLALFIFGAPIEREMGSKEFTLFYLLTGALAGLLSFVMYWSTGQHFVSLIGASGAIFAVMLAFAVMYPDSRIYIWGIIPMPAPILILAYTIFEIFNMVMRPGSGTAHFTHLTGFLFAWLYFMIRFGVNPWKRLRRK